MTPVHIAAVGLAAPGLDGWHNGAAVLRGEQELAMTELPVHQPALLPPNERRRATQAVRLAFRVAEEALASSGLPAEELASVFASSDADTQILDRICSALAKPDRLISPTDFHNSVHNAAPGYWSIAVASRAPSVSLSAWDATFAAGLLEATSLVVTEARDVLLVVYDLRPPDPLFTVRPIQVSSAVALVLTAKPAAPPALSVCLAPNAGAETAMDDAGLEYLRTAGTAMRALPLLRLLARRESGTAVLAGPGSLPLRIEVGQC